MTKKKKHNVARKPPFCLLDLNFYHYSSVKKEMLSCKWKASIINKSQPCPRRFKFSLEAANSLFLVWGWIKRVFVNIVLNPWKCQNSRVCVHIQRVKSCDWESDDRPRKCAIRKHTVWKDTRGRVPSKKGLRVVVWCSCEKNRMDCLILVNTPVSFLPYKMCRNAVRRYIYIQNTALFGPNEHGAQPAALARSPEERFSHTVGSLLPPCSRSVG